MTTPKDHGYWVRYTPAQRPEGVPDNVMFSKRESDGVDWYEYNHSPVHFQADSVKLVMRRFDGSTSWEVGQSNRDVTHLFPPDGSMIMEVLDDAVTDEKWFLGRILQNGVLVQKPPAPPPPQPIKPITRRQLLIGLQAGGFITAQEAIDSAQLKGIPAAIKDGIDSLPTQAERDAATITWYSMSQAERNNPLVAMFAARHHFSDMQVDELFRQWGMIQ